jgi:hypothetical protein
MASLCDGFSRPHISIDWRKQPVNVSVLSARITRLLSEEPPKSTIFIPVVCSTVRQLSKSRRCFANGGAVFSTTYEWRLNCHLNDASWDCDEEPDAEDHEKGKRGSNL